MNTESLTNILSTFFTERINTYLIIACIAIIIIAAIAFIVKKHAACYPVPVMRVIGPSYILGVLLFFFNLWNLITFIIWAVVTLLWIALQSLMSFYND